jgi:hypothetical protein
MEKLDSINRVLELSLEKNGLDYQRMVWCEELSELTKAITKEARCGLTDKIWTDIVEEISDVFVCICEMMVNYKITEGTISANMDYKIKRTLERLSNKCKDNSTNSNDQGNPDTVN